MTKAMRIRVDIINIVQINRHLIDEEALEKIICIKMKHLFPKDWLPILLLIAYSASTYITVIEDGTPEAEDLAKALALSKRFFWRTMMEEWDCHKVTINPNEIGVKHAVELRQICESWNVKALAANAFLKSWEKHEGASSSSSSANIPNDQIKVEKPLFRVSNRELQLSSAMEAIKAAYRVLFGWRAAAGFNTKFAFVNQSDFLHINNGQKISPKGKLNQLKLEEEMENGQKLNYLKEYNKKADHLMNMANLKGLKPMDLKLSRTFNWRNKRQKKKEMEKEKEKGTVNEKFIDDKDKDKQFNDFMEKYECFLAYWDSVQELGLDMEMTCKKVTEMQTKHGANLARMIVDDYVWQLQEIMQFSEYLYQCAVPNPKKMHLERFVGEMFFNYTGFIHYTMLKKYPDQFKHLKKVQNPCDEAKLKVKKIEGSSSMV